MAFRSIPFATAPSRSAPDIKSDASTELTLAVVERANMHADALMRRLLHCGIAPSMYQAPPAFSLEVAAILQLMEWEDSGLNKYLSDLPSSESSWKRLFAELREGKRSFTTVEDATLMCRVLTAIITNCLWDSNQLFEADIAISIVDEEVLAKKLAKIIFDNRMQLQTLINQE